MALHDKKKWVGYYKRFGLYVLLALLFAFFSMAAPNFLSSSNLISILRQVSTFGIAVVGISFVMIGGGMDLSVGGIIATVGMCVGYLALHWHVGFAGAVAFGTLLGCGLGALNGAIAIKLDIAPVIVTLATLLILQGVAYLITGGYPIAGMSDGLVAIGQGYVGPIPVPVIVFFAFVAAGWVVMSKTYIGRFIYALGGNREAARLAGIDVNRLTVGVYVFSGFAASVASLIMLGRANAAQPGAGSGYPFDCMTAACLGGVSIHGGEGKLSGVVTGVVILGILDNGLVLMGASSNFQSVIKGLVLLLAVAFDSYQARSHGMD
jgi:Ribose/xylose/arabinose/galactoside ABC-type transport systems, permease components